jgi:hypothetical protein
MKKLFLTLGACAALAAPAVAGEKSPGSVIIHPSLNMAQGAVGSARNSGDKTQRLGCTVITGLGWFRVDCEAVDADGNTAHCENLYDDGMRQAALSINGDSYIVFTWDRDGGCEMLEVRQNSRYEPKAAL